MNNNDTINQQEADLIQFILWSLTENSDPLGNIKFYLDNYSVVDIPTLWDKFICARHIDWTLKAPTTSDVPQDLDNLVSNW